MLPTHARLHTSTEFSQVTRRGRRGSAGCLVVHLHHSATGRHARAGFVVSKKVGNAVIRNRVTRRLRPLVRARLDALPAGTDLVVRALPAAGRATSRRLGADLDAALAKARRERGR